MLSESQLQVLRTFCDTIVPAVARPSDPHGFWARRATDLGVDQAVAAAVAQLPPEQAAGLAGLLDALAGQGFTTASPRSQEQTLRTLSLMSRDAAGGIAALRGLTLMFHYGGVDPATGRNANWPALGYPGPASVPTDVPKTIVPTTPPEVGSLAGDVVVIGSGAGGGLIAGELAQAGLRVIVLEAGGYFNEADFNQVELWAYQNLYWRGGPTATADGNLTLLAGSCLGGGTTVNWTNSIRTKPWVRQEWADEHGLTGVATDFDRHLDAVWSRLSVNDKCSELNKAQQMIQRGADALGWSFTHTSRNTDPATYDPVQAGFLGFADQSGSKQSTMKTYLQDAFDHDAAVLVRCRATRILVEGGRAVGVEATWTDPRTGASRDIVVRAPQVVVAAGSLESPGVLLRSGIGGPATGDHLRLHPCTAVVGTYGASLEPWWGACHAGLIDEFAPANDGYGFLIEGTQFTTAFAAAGTPWVSGEQHKQALADIGRSGTTIGLLRDRGHGRVTIDAQGQTVPWYALTDPRDIANTHDAVEAQIRCHDAAGADRISVFASHGPSWSRGEDLDAFIAGARRIPLRGGAMALFSAHQMGTCRMGADPATSVADPQGQLHDTPGVWIGDGSAFPTPSGSNPMITIMGLAHRTAENLAATVGTKLQETTR